MKKKYSHAFRLLGRDSIFVRLMRNRRNAASAWCRAPTRSVMQTIRLVRSLPIAADDTTGSLHDKLAALGADMMVEAIQMAADGQLQPLRQPDAGVTYASKIEKAEALIDWALPAAVIDRRVRAFNPFPAALTQLGDESIKVWAASVVHSDAVDQVPGTVLRADGEGILVQTGEGQLLLTELQRAGARRMPAADFLRGFPINPGQRLGVTGISA